MAPIRVFDLDEQVELFESRSGFDSFVKALLGDTEDGLTVISNYGQVIGILIRPDRISIAIKGEP